MPGTKASASSAKPWRLRRVVPPGPEPWGRMARDLDLDPRAARLAWLRGLDHPEDLAWRLDPVWSRCTDPYLLPGVDEAVACIRQAIEKGLSICVYGDYDVDGVTATALLVRVLEKLGAKVRFFIPNRFSDGYGLHLDCIRELKESLHPDLLISVDCGVRSVAEVCASSELGMEWIITDHHSLGTELPPAKAIVHPQLGDYPNRFLAGVGVAFKVAQGLLDSAPDTTFLDGLLKLVAIGTIADMMPLHGENALLVRRGLDALRGANGPGLMALLSAARIETGNVVRAQDIAFGVAPRLNAVGRMGGAEDAVRLLLTRDSVEAQRLAARVESLNTERRKIQRHLAMNLSAPDGEDFDLVVEPSAHKGVIGIVAGQRMRESGRPTGVCTVLDGVAQCSLRAPEGFDLGELLQLAGPFLLSGGGHRAAAGMSFELSKLPFVRQSLQRGAALQARALRSPSLPVDGLGAELVPSPLELDRLEPFGQGFPPVLMVVQGALQAAPQPFGEGHVKLRLMGHSEPLTWFSGAEASLGMLKGDAIRMACTVQDQPRWGRTFLVDGPVGGAMNVSEEAGA
ncbi:MAG: DHH family phosphoesterase [Holophagaceae bacterium]|nr:DHH family phosphoesterase [Holophagaceae bacterium]